MGLFLISQIPWGSNAFEFDTLRCPRPLQICFPGYPMPQLLQVHHDLQLSLTGLAYLPLLSGTISACTGLLVEMDSASLRAHIAGTHPWRTLSDIAVSLLASAVPGRYFSAQRTLLVAHV